MTSKRKYLIKTIKERTVKFDKSYFTKGHLHSTLGAKLQEILNKRDFGCHNDSIAEILSAISGDVLIPLNNAGKILPRTGWPLVALVILKPFGGHNYVVGDVVVSLASDAVYHSSGRLISMLGGAGSSISGAKPGDIRPATPEEIDDLPKAQVDRLSKDVVFLGCD